MTMPIIFIKGEEMRNEYRALVESVISHEGKLRELAASKVQAEKTLADLNQCIAFNEKAVRDAEAQLAQIEERAFASEA